MKRLWQELRPLLGTLAGLPPSPLFLSEILVIAGGNVVDEGVAGRHWHAAAPDRVGLAGGRSRDRQHHR